jgi:uncharacterized protein
MKAWSLLIMPLLLALTVSPPSSAEAQVTPATGPSFSCHAGQDGVAQAVCASPKLSAADREMAKLYDAARTSAFGAGPSNELLAQRQALKYMRDCLSPSAQRTAEQCLQSQYDERSNELATAIAMREPDLALPVIRRTDPEFAPILEAVTLWAAEPIGADWAAHARSAKRTRIETLLRPALTNLLTKEDESYAREILADPAGDGVAVTKLDDIFRSERHFAAFLNVLGPYLGDDGPAARSSSGRRTIPCAAIVRHPALLAATGSVFGSTLDNFVLGNDCEQTLPPAPALSTLTDKLSKGWPPRDGTIRFAAYRIYETTIDKARLGRPESNPKARMPARHGVTSTDVDAARRELAAYYVRYLTKAPALDATMARDAVTEVMSDGQECE